MCGIAGAYGWVDQVTLSEMLACIEHRGPDDEGMYLMDDDRIMMGNRRLAIVDLTGGDQPISNEDGSVNVVFNGEIYNHEKLRSELEAHGHRFSTESDTEVLVHLWEDFGTRMTTKLNGMFAFSIHDRKEDSLFLARDRLGIKPLYYAELPRGFLWASEIPSLLTAGIDRTFDEQAVYNHFHMGSTPWPQTLFQEITKVAPGQSVLVSEGEVTTSRYWSLPNTSNPESSISFQQAADRLRELLTRSVDRRLMADVPLGAFLSGGLDSSSVVALASRLRNEPIKTFSIAFENDAHDESDEAQYVADYFDTDHSEIEIDISSMDFFGKYVEFLGEPTGGLPLLPIFALSEFASEEVKVVLTGEGPDEMIGGYPPYYRIPKWKERTRFVPTPVHRLSGAIGDVTPIGRKYFKVLGCLRDNRKINLSRCRGFEYAKPVPESYLETDKTPDTSGILAKIDEAISHAREGDVLQSMTAFDIQHQLPDDVLFKSDVTSMAASLEARVPFLDHEIVEFLFELPSEYKVNEEGHKMVLKEAMRGVLPERTISRDKFGMGIPADDWFRTDYDAVAQWMTEEKLDRAPYLDATAVRDMWRQHQKGDIDIGQTLLYVLTYTIWYHKLVRLQS